MGTDGETETLASEPRPPSKDNEVRTRNDGDPDNAILLHKCLPDLLVTRRGHYLHTRRRSQVCWWICSRVSLPASAVPISAFNNLLSYQHIGWRELVITVARS